MENLSGDFVFWVIFLLIAMTVLVLGNAPSVATNKTAEPAQNKSETRVRPLPEIVGTFVEASDGTLWKLSPAGQQNGRRTIRQNLATGHIDEVEGELHEVIDRLLWNKEQRQARQQSRGQRLSLAKG